MIMEIDAKLMQRKYVYTVRDILENFKNSQISNMKASLSLSLKCGKSFIS